MKQEKIVREKKVKYHEYRIAEKVKTIFEEKTTPEKLLSPKGAIVFSEH